MPDKSAENLARIRACDADWNENDHPRADNGQFTSGSGGGGVKLSKFKGQSGKVKAEREKAYREQVETQKKIDSLNSKLENSPEYRKANRNASLGTGQTRIAGEEERARLKKEADKELDPLREQWRNAYAKQRSLANKVGGKFKNATKAVKEYADQERLGKNLMHNELSPLLHPEMERFHNAVKSETDRVIKEGKKEKKKRDAAKATLEKARPKIQAMRQLAQASASAAKAAKPAAAPASKKDALVKKINADPKLKAEVMSLKGKPKAPAAPAKSKAQLKKEYEAAFKAYQGFTEPRSGGMRLQYPNEADRLKAMKAAKEKVSKAEKAYMQALENESKK